MPNLKINEALEPFLFTPKPIKVAIGGRGSGKSIGIVDMLTYQMHTEGFDVYCLREFQDSINDSVHKVFKSAVQDRLKLDGWDLQQNTVIAPNGARTTYKGANRNPDSIMSAAHYQRSFFEESHRASKDSLDKLLPTIIRNPGAECWFAANPQSAADPFSQRFIIPYQDELDKHGYYEDDLHLIVSVNWRDNSFWNAELEQLRQWDYDNRPRAEYDWIWEGKFNDSVDSAIIKPEWFDACLDAHKLDRFAGSFSSKGSRVLSLDPFDDGGDAAGLVLRHGSVVEKVAERNEGEIDEICYWGMDEALKLQADWFIWDGDGMGAGLKGQVRNKLDGSRLRYHMFRGSLSGSGQDNADLIYTPLGEKEHDDDNRSAEDMRRPKTYADTFKNNRAQYYKTLADRMFNTWRCVERGEYVDPDDMLSIDTDGVGNLQKLRSEVCRIPTRPNGNGLIQICSKQEMAKMTPPIASPNMADALMMSMCSPTAVESEAYRPRRNNKHRSWMTA